ncbi:unnamed protein product [Gongylonema pulchrum]|uniref:SEA domain-containing protein n=1 Tax=Gongylonema pulchrum TaxID=637853 RepID=A0A183DW86_9BILA|nr:unnamed protein product [Gongylonema pulchrum]
MYGVQSAVVAQQHQQQSQSPQQQQPQQFPDLYSELQKSGIFYEPENMPRKVEYAVLFVIILRTFDDPSPRYKLKLIMWLALLFVIVGMVVVVLILTISKMQAISSASFHSLRRFEGHFLMTEGPLLKFDGKLLQKNTKEYAEHANKIQRQLDLIYRQGGYGLIYAGSEVTRFRFVPAVPALDVSFVLKTRSDMHINVFDFLSVLRNYVRTHGFDGNTIDDKSISLESKHSR